LRCFQPQVAIDNLTVVAGQHGRLETELPDGAHPIHGRIVLKTRKTSLSMFQAWT